MNKYIEATQIIRNEAEYDYETFTWKPFDPQLREKAFNAFKSFVAATARGDRRRRIMDSGYYNVSDWGILRRLWYHPDTDTVEYCCGQE